MNDNLHLVNYLLALLSSNGFNSRCFDTENPELTVPHICPYSHLFTQFVPDGINITLITHCDSIVSLSDLSRLIRSFSWLLPIIS